MNSKKPVYFILRGSVYIVVLTFLVLLGSKVFFFNLSYAFVLLFPLILGVLSFVIFYYFVGNILSERLVLIFKLISSNNMQDVPKVNLSSNILSDTEILVKNWASKRADEIEKLKGQEKFRRDFIGNLAHELKTPIFAIQGYVETLLDGALDDPEVNVRFLERTAGSVERMIQLLDELDQITYYESGRVKLEITQFNIVQLIKEVIQTVEYRAVDKNIKIAYQGKYSEVLVSADRSKIMQVLINLVQNSIAYGIDHGQTNIQIYPMNELLLVEVSDNGVGIEQSNLNRIFERFYRVEESRSRNEGGSGLGLVIVKNILDAHNQNVNVRSTPSYGSTFTFSLQLASSKDDEVLITSHGFKVR